jgi:hypothetical protein
MAQSAAGFAGSDKIVDTQSCGKNWQVRMMALLTKGFFSALAGYLSRRLGSPCRSMALGALQKDGKEVWYPIPRDRDQAFAKFDGLLPALADNSSFLISKGSIKRRRILELTYVGRHLDRIFLNN